MTDPAANSPPAPIVQSAIASLKRLGLASIAAIAADQLIALSALCAHWDHAIGEELVRRHRKSADHGS